MAILPRTYLGESILRERARPVPHATLKTTKFKALIRDMLRTMHAAYGVGLAAPQIGIAKRLAVLELRAPGRADTKVWPKTVIVNPLIRKKSKTMVEDWEGCLSIPGLKGIVPRHRSIEVRYLDEHGARNIVRLTGYIARVFQHEIDHLNGMVYLDRMKDSRTLSFTSNPFKKA